MNAEKREPLLPPKLKLHVPVPAARPGDTPDFSNLKIAPAGAANSARYRSADPAKRSGRCPYQRRSSLDGATSVSLGTQTPMRDILRAAASQNADIVALSFSSAYPTNQVADALAELRARLPVTIELWAGGANPALARCEQSGLRVVRGLDEVGDIGAGQRLAFDERGGNGVERSAVALQAVAGTRRLCLEDLLGLGVDEPRCLVGVVAGGHQVLAEEDLAL